MGTYHEYMLEGISDKRNLSIHRQSLQQTGTLSVETEDVGQPLTSKGRDPVSIFCRAKCSSTLKSEREWKKRKNRWLTSWQLVQWNLKKYMKQIVVIHLSYISMSNVISTTMEVWECLIYMSTNLHAKGACEERPTKSLWDPMNLSISSQLSIYIRTGNAYINKLLQETWKKKEPPKVEDKKSTHPTVQKHIAVLNCLGHVNEKIPSAPVITRV